MGDPTEAEIKTLNKTLKASKGYVYNNIVCDFNKIVYAYPQSMGALTSIKDVVNNFNYTDSFTRTSVKVDNINYYLHDSGMHFLFSRQRKQDWAIIYFYHFKNIHVKSSPITF